MLLWRGITDAERGFQDGIRELGYDGEYTIINANQDRSKFAGLLRKKLVPQLNEFNYIYSFGTTSTQMVTSINKGRIPQIFNIVTDPIKAGVANSMESAGENICGVSHKISLSLQVENALRLKKIKTLAFLYNAREANSNIIKNELEFIAEQYQFNLLEFRSAPVDDLLEKNLQRIKEKSNEIDAVYLPLDSFLVSKARLIGNHLKEAGIMSIGALKEYVSQGVLLGLVPDYYKLGKVAAKIVDRHVKGEKLSTIPVQTEKEPKIIINESTRKLLKIKIPKNILENAVIIE